jgi:hypothetical protein
MMNRFQVVSTNSEQILNLPVNNEESLGMLDGLKAPHLTFLFPGMLVGDFCPVVLIWTRSMLDRGEDLAMSGRIAPELISDQLPRQRALSLQHLAKEPLSSSFVSSLRHQYVENITVLIHCSPEIHLLSLDLDEDLIDVPDVAQSTLLPSQRPSVLRSELPTPEADGFVRNDDATFGQQILNIAETQCESVVQPDGVADDLGRKSVTFVAGLHAPIVVDPADCSST